MKGQDAQIQFVLSLVRNGAKWKDIREQFDKKWQNVSDRTFARRIAAAYKLFTEEQQLIQKETEELLKKEAEKKKQQILSVLERKELLSKIAKGLSDKEKGIIITTADRINAIKELNKMEGGYEPSKIELTQTPITIRVIRE
jgi:predicted nucleotide-binding protein (sugar kinase/HSP70/actin superfamily)